jgi:hypothetical protein
LDSLHRIGCLTRINDIIPLKNASVTMSADFHCDSLLHARVHQIANGRPSQIVNHQTLDFRCLARIRECRLHCPLRALTDSQRLWITQFLATESALAATKVAYKAKSEANNRVLSYEIAKNKSIVAALDVAAGRIPKVVVQTERETTEQRQRQQLIATVRKQLKAAETGSIAASKFSAQLERLQLGVKPEVEDDPETPEASSTDTQAFPIGSIIVQDGKRYQVKAEEMA